MPRRNKKRIHAFRGTRTCGTGNKKNGRGAGNRGGRGNSGLKKNKFTKVTAKMPDYFKKKGFVRPTAKKSGREVVINLYDIEKIAKGNYPNIPGGAKNLIAFDASKSELVFKGKVLGTGQLHSAVNVKAYKWSKRAEEKITALRARYLSWSD